MKAKVYNLEGKTVNEIDLNPSIFDVQISTDLVHQAVVAQLANSRQVLAHTKTRGEVRGGGRKPWKQKGTGRARHGSIRSPLWKGGGVTFGPTKDRNFTKDINKKMKRKALMMTLSNKVSTDSLRLLESFDFAEAKTKKMFEVFKTLELADKKILVVLPEQNDAIRLAARNLPNVKVLLADSLNVVDVLNKDIVLMPVSCLNIIEKVYLK